jgi:predicted HTH transcriptional regulator
MLEITFGRTKDFIATQAGMKDLNKLTEDDKAALLFIQQKGKVSRGEFAVEFGLSEKTALRRLAKLIDLGLLKIKGKAKATVYYCS